MTVGVGVVADREVEAIAKADEARHCKGRRAVHADLSVPVGSHEAECRVDPVLDHLSAKFVPADDLAPVADARAAQRVDAKLQSRVPDRLEVDDACEVADIMAHIIVAVNRGRMAGALIWDAPDVACPAFEQPVGIGLDPAGDGRIGRPARRRVIFEAAIFGRIVRRSEDHAVGKSARTPAIVSENGVRNYGRRRVAVIGVDHHRDVVRDEHLQRGDEGRSGQGMGVDAEEQRAAYSMLLAIEADRLGDRHDVRLVEGIAECGAAMARGAEMDALR